MSDEMNKENGMEAAYLLADGNFLHLKEADDGISYAVYNAGTKEQESSGVINLETLEDSPYGHLLTAARMEAMEEAGIGPIPAAEVSLRMLEPFHESGIRRREMFEPETLPKDDIRFIDSHYNELFRIPDGGSVEVQYPDRTFSAPCKYLDDYHVDFGNQVLHICQLAEILEKNGGSCRPEPETDIDEAAWQLGGKGYLAIQTSEDGYDYTLYDRTFHEIDGGQLDDPSLSMNEARNDILQDTGLGGRSRTMLSYDFVMEKAEEVAEREMPKPSALGQLKALKEDRAEPKPPAKKPHEVGR